MIGAYVGTTKGIEMTPALEQAQCMRQLAETYRAWGFNLVPLGADKRPVVTGVNAGGGVYRFRWEDWQTQPQTAKLWQGIRKPEWWTEVAGIAAVCGPVSGDLVCIDFDKTEFGSVDTFLSLLNLSFLWVVDTPGGGWHVWLRCPGLTLDKGKLDQPAATGNGHIELRHVGHYAALPGSAHPSGGTYAWHSAPPVGPPPTVAQTALLDAYHAVTVATPKAQTQPPTTPVDGNGYHQPEEGANKWAQAALASEVDELKRAAVGGRNAALNKAAFALGSIVAGGYLTEHAVIDALTAAAQAIGLDADEISATLDSGLQSGAKSPRHPSEHSASAVETYEYGFVVETPEPLHFKAGKPSAVDPDDEGQPALCLSDRIESDLIDWGYSFTLCELDDTIEVNGKRIDDIMRSQLRMRARDAGYGGKYGTPLQAMEDHVLVLAARHAYHPVKRYLESLTWDGQDHFAVLAPHLKDRHPPIVYPDGQRKPVIEAWLWRWLIGSIAKVYSGGGVIRAQNPMLVLSGMQNMGKSTFAAWICALPEMFLESSINPDSADHLRYLVTKWIWEVGELGATTRRSDREALKAFLTRQEATFRVPYGHHPIIKPALASFIGTVNPMNTGFLDDPTGSRRFITAELSSIDHGYIGRVDVNQLWAQIKAVYDADPNAWRLEPCEQEMRDKINGENEVERPYEGIVTRLFETDPLRTDWWMPTHEIVNVVQTFGGANFDETRHHGVLGATLRGLGLERKQKRLNGETVWGYYGIQTRPTFLQGPPD